MKNRKHLKATLSYCLVLFIGFMWSSFPSPVSAQQKVEYKWRFGSAWRATERNESLKLFCELIEYYSNGKAQVKFQPAGLLGTHDEIFHGVRDGSIEMAIIAPYVNLVPGGMLNWMPWTVSNFDEAAFIYGAPNGMLYKIMDDVLAEVGMKLLFNAPAGPYGFANNKRPIKTPDDFQNLKMRVSPSLGLVRAWQNMGKGTGMIFQTTPWTELYSSLERGVVDSCWDLWNFLLEEKHYEVLEYYTTINWAWDNTNVVINRDLWDSLPKDMQEAITKAAAHAEKRDFEANRRLSVTYREKLTALGLKINDLTDEEREVFRKKADMPAIWKELCQPWLDKRYPGQNMTQKIQDELERVKQQLGR